MANLDDILTTQRNGVVAINSLNTTINRVTGSITSTPVSNGASSLAYSGGGRIANISITSAGSAPGYIYDSASTSSLGTPIIAIPNTIGVFQCGVNFTSGLVITAGTSQVVNVTYSPN